MAVQYPTVDSGQSVTSAFQVALGRPLAIVSPASIGGAVTLEFALASTGVWARLNTPDGTGSHFLLAGAPGGVPFSIVTDVPPTPWVRLVCATSQSGVRSFSLIDQARA